MILKLKKVYNNFPSYNIEDLKTARDKLQKSYDIQFTRFTNVLALAVFIIQLTFIIALDSYLLSLYQYLLLPLRVIMILFSLAIITVNNISLFKIRGLYQIVLYITLSLIFLTITLSITDINNNILISWSVLVILIMGLIPIPINHSVYICLLTLPVFILTDIVVYREFSTEDFIRIVRSLIILGAPSLLLKKHFLLYLECISLKRSVETKNKAEEITCNGEYKELELNVNIQKQKFKDNKRSLLYILDNNPNNLYKFKKYLNTQYNIILFHNLESFILQLDIENPPDLIVIDEESITKNMKCRLIKGIIKLDKVPVLLTTTESNNTFLNPCLNGCINDYLNRPIIEKELLARVRSLLQLKEALSINKNCENIISIIELIVIMTHDIKSLGTEDILNDYITTLNSLIKNFDGKDYLEYQNRITTLSNNLTPYIKENPYIAKLIAMLSGFVPEKISFSRFIEKYKITKHQAEIIKLLFEGEVTHTGIAKKLNKTKTNISSTLNRIYNKVGVSNQAELMLNIENIYFKD